MGGEVSGAANSRLVLGLYRKREGARRLHEHVYSSRHLVRKSSTDEMRVNQHLSHDDRSEALASRDCGLVSSSKTRPRS